MRLETIEVTEAMRVVTEEVTTSDSVTACPRTERRGSESRRSAGGPRRQPRRSPHPLSGARRQQGIGSPSLRRQLRPKEAAQEVAPPPVRSQETAGDRKSQPKEAAPAQGGSPGGRPAPCQEPGDSRG